MRNTLTSRSLITDKTLLKFQKTFYNGHKQKLRSIYQRSSLYENCEQQHEQQLIRLQKSKKANNYIKDKISSQIHIQNKSIINHIMKINMRRYDSVDNIKINNNHFKEQQQKSILKENKLIFQKIAQKRFNFRKVKKQLQKQFQNYQQTKNRLRKIKIDSQQLINTKKAIKIKRSPLKLNRNLNRSLDKIIRKQKKNAPKNYQSSKQIKLLNIKSSRQDIKSTKQVIKSARQDIKSIKQDKNEKQQKK